MTRTPYHELVDVLQSAVDREDMTPTQLSELAVELVRLPAAGLAAKTEAVRARGDVAALGRWVELLLGHARVAINLFAPTDAPKSITRTVTVRITDPPE